MEIWKDIVGYNGKYQVSNYGQIKNAITGNIKKPRTSKDGYSRINLQSNGKRATGTIHRFVALAFIPNPYNYATVNHKDENKLNNYVDNLEWCTTQYNSKYGTGRQRAALSKGKPIAQYTLDGDAVAVYPSIVAAMRHIGAGHIGACCRGRCHTAVGYVWRYSD